MQRTPTERQHPVTTPTVTETVHVMTLAQCETLAAMLALGAKITSTKVHPYSGALTIRRGRETVYIVGTDGATQYARSI